jgi:hypothetical protein
MKHVNQTYVVPSELISRWHPAKPHQLFNRRHLTIAIHAGDRSHAIVLYIEREKLL